MYSGILKGARHQLIKTFSVQSDILKGIRYQRTNTFSVHSDLLKRTGHDLIKNLYCVLWFNSGDKTPTYQNPLVHTLVCVRGLVAFSRYYTILYEGENCVTSCLLSHVPNQLPSEKGSAVNKKEFAPSKEHLLLLE